MKTFVKSLVSFFVTAATIFASGYREFHQATRKYQMGE